LGYLVGFLKFTVTGVYSSAISKMLLENGHEPTRLSNTLVQPLVPFLDLTFMVASNAVSTAG